MSHIHAVWIQAKKPLQSAILGCSTKLFQEPSLADYGPQIGLFFCFLSSTLPIWHERKGIDFDAIEGLGLYSMSRFSGRHRKTTDPINLNGSISLIPFPQMDKIELRGIGIRERKEYTEFFIK